jgi:sugar transferase (PEP-CTERM/EpsH1 system associated)
MKILWLNAGLLLPLDKGGRLRTWHLLRHLAARHEVTYLAFADGDAGLADREGMRAVCRELVTVPRHDPVKGTVRFYLDAAGHLFHRQPYAVAKYASATYRRAIARLCAGKIFDVIVSDFLPPVVNLPSRLPCPAVLFTHNVEAEIWRRHVDTARGKVRRRLLESQWRRMLRFEADALRRFDLILAVSETDRETLRRLYRAAWSVPVHVVRTGVDTEFFHPPPATGRRAPHLVFTGSMDWLPNEDAMVHFCREVLPLIREAEPRTTLAIVGRAPTPAVRRLAHLPGVEVTGRVEDVRPEIARGAVYVVPLRIGGGTRLKIFEAMAMGKAVVSTKVGAEGLPVTDGRDIVIADEPPAFARAVVSLLRDDAARGALEDAARRLVVDHFDWGAVAGDLEAALDRASRAVRLRTTDPVAAGSAGDQHGARLPEGATRECS